LTPQIDAKPADRLNRRQRAVLVLLTIFVALTRVLAIARSPFDWDEALFALAIYDYDVVVHHPHPPGYPIFVAAAKLIHAAGVGPYRSLQVIVVLGAVALFPSLYFLAREVGFAFHTAVIGAAIYCFLPNIWIYGGTAFSDVPAAALAFVSAALLLRGYRSSISYVFGGLLLGISIGIRPPALLLALIPGLVGSWGRLRARDLRSVMTGVALCVVSVFLAYAGAARATGSVDGYLETVRTQAEYVRETDSWRNPNREPLHEVAEDFFIRPVKSNLLYIVITLALVSLISAPGRSGFSHLLLVLIFAPYSLMAWLSLDFAAVSRYSVPYLAAYALLAADGLSVLSRKSVRMSAVAAALLVVTFTIWTWPALTLQRSSDSPPVAALKWIRENVSYETPVYIYSGMRPLADLFAAERATLWEKPEDIPVIGTEAWVLDLKPAPEGHNFIWPRTNPLWDILRRRNFEASVARVTARPVFGEGWYAAEGESLAPFRWMAKRATLSLHGLRERGRLAARFYVPADALPLPPRVEVYWNGMKIEEIRNALGTVDRQWLLDSRPEGMNELVISTSATVNPAREGLSSDSRDLGLRLDSLSWTAAGRR
jgi:hypothetical protein